MRHMPRLPGRFPENTKYVLEVRGPMVRRYVEFPDGLIVELAPRKAQTCNCQALRALSPAPRKKPAQAAA